MGSIRPLFSCYGSDTFPSHKLNTLPEASLRLGMRCGYGLDMVPNTSFCTMPNTGPNTGLNTIFSMTCCMIHMSSRSCARMLHQAPLYWNHIGVVFFKAAISVAKSYPNRIQIVFKSISIVFKSYSNRIQIVFKSYLKCMLGELASFLDAFTCVSPLVF